MEEVNSESFFYPRLFTLYQAFDFALFPYIKHIYREHLSENQHLMFAFPLSPGTYYQSKAK